jgi:hypothetical protein
MKKFVTLVLILSLGLFTVVGCGSGTKKGTGGAPVAEKDKPKAP